MLVVWGQRSPNMSKTADTIFSCDSSLSSACEIKALASLFSFKCLSVISKKVGFWHVSRLSNLRALFCVSGCKTNITTLHPLYSLLHNCMSRLVKLNIPRGGGPASACFSPTKHDLVRVTPMCLMSQHFEARSPGLMGVVWYTVPTPLIYPYWNLQALLRKDWLMSHDSVLFCL